mgnify:FL=1|jgi:hypothetical protein|tara:strand:- start:807 stop:1004 length:198 start_codon:yes stop_codon:yes gene_type:complete
MSLDSILNVLIPVGVFFFLGASLYKGLKEPIDRLIELIKTAIGGRKSNKDQEAWTEEQYAYYPKY